MSDDARKPPQLRLVEQPTESAEDRPSARRPITALRVLGCGFDVKLDPRREELIIGREYPPATDVRLEFQTISRRHARLTRDGDALKVQDLGSKLGIQFPHPTELGRWVSCREATIKVGDTIKLANIRILALDELTARLAKPLERHLGRDNHDEVDRALEAIARERMLIIRGKNSAQLAALAHLIHLHSARRGELFTCLDEVPETDDAIHKLCARIAKGTVYLDMAKRFSVPRLFSRHLFGEHFDLWTIVGTTSTLARVLTDFGDGWHDPKRLGFAVSAVGFTHADEPATRLWGGCALFDK